MPWYAVDAVGDAVHATREFLLPFDAGRWLRLAVVAFFLGGGGNAGYTAGTPGRGDEPFVGPPDVRTPDLPPDALELAAALLAALVALGLLFALVSAVMRLVFLDALRADAVRLRGPFRRRLGQGARLFGFALGVGLLFALPLIALGGLFVATGPALDPAGVAGLAALVGVGLLLSVPYGLLVGFTNSFVAPVMVATDCGVLAGWRRFWPVLRREWAQFLVYLLVRFLLTLAVGVVVGLVAAAVAAVVAVVLLAVGFAASLPLGGVGAALGSPAGLAVVAVLGIAGVLLVSVALLPVRIPVLTYFVAYELLVLRRAAPEFDLLPWYGSGSGGLDPSGDAAP